MSERMLELQSDSVLNITVQLLGKYRNGTFSGKLKHYYCPSREHLSPLHSMSFET